MYYRYKYQKEEGCIITVNVKKRKGCNITVDVKKGKG